MKEVMMMQKEAIMLIVVPILRLLSVKQINIFIQNRNLFPKLQTNGYNKFHNCKSIIKYREKNIKFLSGLMIKTGGLLAKQIDKVVKKNIPSYQKDHLYRVIS
jgi:hypothetical protein